MIEPLEPRIAPAVLLNATTVRFTDVDGDIATVSISKGSLDLATNFVFHAAGRGEQLQSISLVGTGPDFSGANLRISSVRVEGGDGSVHVGSIDARGIDLGVVKVSGDLGRIQAGDEDAITAGIDFLKVRSLGRFGLGTQPAGAGSLESKVAGNLVTVLVSGSVSGALSVAGSSEAGGGNIGSVTIGGDVTAGAGLRATGNIGEISVHGEVRGSSAAPVVISGGGLAAGDAAALGKVRIEGRVAFAKILAGYDLAGAAVNGDARISRVQAGGNWVASSIVAGATAGPDGVFGTTDDTNHFPNLDTAVASIGSIQIAGIARGTAGLTTDHFGFVAEHLGVVKIAGKSDAPAARREQRCGRIGAAPRRRQDGRLSDSRSECAAAAPGAALRVLAQNP